MADISHPLRVCLCVTASALIVNLILSIDPSHLCVAGKIPWTLGRQFLPVQGKL